MPPIPRQDQAAEDIAGYLPESEVDEDDEIVAEAAPIVAALPAYVG